jgi:hypothetical protein
MKCFYSIPFVVFILLSSAGLVNGALALKIGKPKTYGQKAIVKMDLQNTFTNNIESVRAAVFLLNDSGKIVGQETRWILGGTKERPALAPMAKTTFHFVVQSTKPFSKTKVTVTRIVLEGGILANVYKDVQMESVVK